MSAAAARAGAGPQRPFSRHLSELCAENAATAPDRLAIVSGDTVLTYGDLDRRVSAFAAAFASLGTDRGSTVGLLCTNRWEWICAAIGATRLGARVAAFNTFAKAWDLSHMLSHSEAEVILTIDRFRSQNYVDILGELIPELDEPGWRSERFPALREVVVIGDGDVPAGARQLRALLEESRPAVPPRHVSAADDAFVLYTSGSSARPKAVPLQHYAVIENGFNIGERMRLTPEDRVWISVPLFWSYGSSNALPATLTHRAALVLQEAFEPAGALDLIETHGCTALYTLPNMTRALIAHPTFAGRRLPGLRTGLTLGGSDDIRRAAETLGAASICNIYGGTETYGNCCVTPAEWPLERKLDCQGPPLPGVSIRIADEETGAELPRGSVGEIHVRGYLSRGYLGGDPAQLEGFGADGWFRTGDLGYLDDEDGMHFVARATEMIKTGGVNVAPAEVEELLLLHEEVEAVAVVGVPDETAGQIVVAFVVPAEGASPTASDLRSFCAERVASFKVPAFVHIIDELPRTDTEKLARRSLLALHESGPTPEPQRIGGR